VKKVSFLPVMIDQKLCPEPLRRSDSCFHEITCYMRSISEAYNDKCTVEGDEVVIMH
jgi:hypothetical protein